MYTEKDRLNLNAAIAEVVALARSELDSKGAAARRAGTRSCALARQTDADPAGDAQSNDERDPGHERGSPQREAARHRTRNEELDVCVAVEDSGPVSTRRARAGCSRLLHHEAARNEWVVEQPHDDRGAQRAAVEPIVTNRARGIQIHATRIQ